MNAYRVFLNEIKQEFSSIIEEADNNEQKWFELFVNKGSETETIDSGNTFDEAVSSYEHHIKDWGVDKIFLDIWTNKDIDNCPSEVLVSLWNKDTVIQFYLKNKKL